MTDEQTEEMTNEGAPVPPTKDELQEALKADLPIANRELNEALFELLTAFAKRLPLLVMAKVLQNAAMDMLVQQGAFSAQNAIKDYEEKVLLDKARPQIEIARF